MANSFSSSTLTAERFSVPVAAQLGNHEKGSTGNENASDNEDEVLSVGGVSQPPSPQAVVTSSVLEPASNPTLATYSRLDALQAIPAASESVSYKSVGQNEGLELDHKLGSQPVIRLTDAETHLDATKAVQVSPTALPVQESSPSLLHEDEMELPRRSPLSGPDRSSSSSEPDIDPGECTSPQPSAALKFSIDNILNPNFGRSLLPGTAANALGRELLHRHPHLYCHPLLTAAKEMLLAVTAAEMRPSVASAPASHYPSRENNHHYFNPHLAALQINNSLLNQSQGISTSAAAGPNTSSKKGHGNALYANWRTLNGNNRPDQMSSLTPPSSSGIVMDLSIRSGHGNAGYGAGGSLSSPSHGSASPGGISTCSNSSSGDCSSQLFAAAAGAAASPAATGSGKLATHSGDLLSAASTPATKPESSSDSTGSTQQNLLWPAWVYCTRYSDRPSSGPRTRRIRKKDKKPDEKRPRTAFTAEQLARLKTEFSENRYLTEKRRQDLARELQLHENQIKIWFQNKRAKIKKASGQKNPLALQLMAQGLYNHSTIPLRDDEDIDSME